MKRKLQLFFTAACLGVQLFACASTPVVDSNRDAKADLNLAEGSYRLVGNQNSEECSDSMLSWTQVDNSLTLAVGGRLLFFDFNRPTVTEAETEVPDNCQMAYTTRTEPGHMIQLLEETCQGNATQAGSGYSSQIRSEIVAHGTDFDYTRTSTTTNPQKRPTVNVQCHFRKAENN